MNTNQPNKGAAEMAILTLKQYMERDHRRVVAEYGVPLAEVRRLYPVNGYLVDWWRYVEESFNNGEDFTPQAVAKLTVAQIRDLSRTTRGLRGGMPRNYLLRSNSLAIA